jgi:uroporphyrinogen-III synthase
MQHSKIPILCTRPLSRQLISRAEQHGLEIDIIPFIRTEALQSAEISNRIGFYAGQTVAAVFTSMNAAETVIKELNGVKPSWRIYCLDNTTRDTLIQYFGINSIFAFANSANQLANKIIEINEQGKVVFFCGDQRREELPLILNDHKIDMEEVIVYRTIQVINMINKLYQGIMFFSPSAVASFFSTNQVGDNTVLFAIGKTTAESIKTYCNNRIVVGDVPGKESLVNKMIAYYLALNEHKITN